MRLFWWPIYIDAKLESEGVRVIGDEGGAVIPSWTLVPWTQVSRANLPHPIDENGHDLKINGRQLVFRFGSYWKAESRGIQKQIQQAQRKWFADPGNHFKFNALPMSRTRAVLRSVILEINFAMYAFALGAIMLVPGLNMPNPRARVLNHWIGLGLMFVVCVLLSRVLYRVISAKNALWVILMTEDGAEIENRNQARFVSWSAVTSIRLDALLFTATIDGSERAFIAPCSCTKAILESRVQIEPPRLVTPGFVFIGVLAALAGPVVLWCYQWLQVPIQGLNWQSISLVCLLFWGTLFLHHFMARRELRRVNETNTPQIP